MLYVSKFNKQSGLYGITDTDDGTEEFYSKEDIIKMLKVVNITGATANSVKVVNASKEVAQTTFDSFGDSIRQLINKYSYDACLEIARRAHFVRQIQGLENNMDEVHRITYEQVYPRSVQEVVETAVDYSNRLREVDVSNPDNIKDALRNNVCLVLQHKTNGVLTAFICTGSLSVVDSIYGIGFFDSLYLTKQLYSCTKNINSVRKEPAKKEKNPDLLNVFSCSLRFRRTGKNHDGLQKELSSPFYSVNLPNVLSMYVLENPHSLGDSILPEFKKAHNQDEYDFDFDMYNDILECCEDGTNYFGNENTFMKYVDTDSLKKGVELSGVIQRFQDNFDYMEYLRGYGYSFK